MCNKNTHTVNGQENFFSKIGATKCQDFKSNMHQIRFLGSYSALQTPGCGEAKGRRGKYGEGKDGKGKEGPTTTEGERR